MNILRVCTPTSFLKPISPPMVKIMKVGLFLFCRIKNRISEREDDQKYVRISEHDGVLIVVKHGPADPLKC